MMMYPKSEFDVSASALHFVPMTPLDHWVGRELKRSYDITLAEPVPDDLLRLLEQFPADC